MLESATRICEAKFGLMHLCEAGAFRLVAGHNVPPALTEYLRNRGLYRPRAGGPSIA